MPDHGYFGSQSVTWKVFRETILSLGGSRAVLMQLAHPLVAMGVSEHSNYTKDPFGRAERTFMLSQMLVFGSTQTARQAARMINQLHAHVSGTLPANAGGYPAGIHYHARDPQLLLWVHATLIDTALLIYLLFVGPLSQEEQERYYQESRAVASLLGLAPIDMPATLDDLRRYVHEMAHSNRLAATPQARQLARRVLFPPVPKLLRPLLYLNFYVTCALLPQPIREIYGLEWGKKRQKLFDLSTKGARLIISHLPLSVRVFPITWKMMQRGTAA